jgi:uncharacterized protein (TIGR02231 family)
VVEAAVVQMDGPVVTWHYAAPVDLRSGADAVKIALGAVTLAPDLHALAIPRLADTAYLEAEFTNTGPEPLLPGPATLYRDGTAVGQAELPLIAAGAEATLGFGPLDGIALTRIVPSRSEGDRGVISKSNRIEETAILTVDNRSGQDWPVKLVDQVPYSEQDDLKIAWQATPQPTETDPEGERGLLVWRFDLAAGAKREIRLSHSLDWPSGMELR